jgi:hypothetical protein
MAGGIIGKELYGLIKGSDGLSHISPGVLLPTVCFGFNWR